MARPRQREYLVLLAIVSGLAIVGIWKLHVLQGQVEQKELPRFRSGFGLQQPIQVFAQAARLFSIRRFVQDDRNVSIEPMHDVQVGQESANYSLEQKLGWDGLGVDDLLHAQGFPHGLLDLRHKFLPSIHLAKQVNRRWHVELAGVCAQACRKLLELVSIWSESPTGPFYIHRADTPFERILVIHSDQLLDKVLLVEPNVMMLGQQGLLKDLLHTIRVTPMSLVRMYMERIPPNKSDELHFQRGYWATRSHRLIIPLQGPIELSIGKTFAAQEQNTLILEPFHIHEVNNRAVHRLRNPSNDSTSIHLCLDFVEPNDQDLLPAAVRISGASLLIRDEVWKQRAESPLIPDTFRANRPDDPFLYRHRELALQQSRLREGDIRARDLRNILDEFYPKHVWSWMHPFQHQFDSLTSRTRFDDRLQSLRAARVDNYKQTVYIVAGSMKAGTTAVYYYMKTLFRGFATPATKELRAFTTNWHNLSESAGRNQLERLWSFGFSSQKARYLLFGDASPDYLLWGSQVFHRILSAIPHAKYVVILRDPVERIWSRYKMDLALFNITRFYSSLEELLQVDLKVLRMCQVDAVSTTATEFEANYLSMLPSFDFKLGAYVNHMDSNPGMPLNPKFHAPELGAGLYTFQIELLLGVIPREQVLFIKYEDFQRNNFKYLRHLARFLQVPMNMNRVFRESRWNDYSNSDGPPRDSFDKLRPALAKFYQPFNQRLQTLVPELDLNSWTHADRDAIDLDQLWID